MPSSSAVSALSLPERLGLTRASELRAGWGGWAGRAAPAWPLGWPELDAALPGGVPRGQVTEWAGRRSAGKTAALRQLVRAVRESGAGAAYVDGTGTLAPAPWVFGGLSQGALPLPPFWVVRPPGPGGVLAAVEELCRSGAFGLVIAEGAEWSRTPVVRLQRLAREMGAALVAVVDRAGRVPLAGFRVQFSTGPGSRSCRVRVQGRLAKEVSFVRELPYRLPRDSGYPDRRGNASERRVKPRR